jgi:hypothetical protein
MVEMNNLVIIGCGRSGTKFISKHLGLGHEKLEDSGLACWQSVVDGNGFYDIQPGDFILHQVRHPLDVISSCHTILMQSSWELIHRHIDSVDEEDSLLSKCMNYWYHWNLMAEKRALATYRVEDVFSEVSHSTNTRKEWEAYNRIEWIDLKREDRKLCKAIRKLAKRYGYDV